jgi:hypothetical protein
VLQDDASRPATPTLTSTGLPPGVTVISIHPMYSPGQICGAAFLGGAIGGGWLLAVNYKRLGRPRAARATIALCVVGLLSLFALGWILPPAPLAFVPLVVMSAVSSAQSVAYNRHVKAGGSVASNWRVVGIALASLVITFAALFCTIFVYQLVFKPHQIKVAGGNVRFDDGGTRDEAQAVGDALVAMRYFTPDHPAGAQVLRDHGRHVIELVKKAQAFDDEQLQIQDHALADELSRRAFDGGEVDIWLADPHLEPHVKLPWETRPHTLTVAESQWVRYLPGIQEVEARAVAAVLQEHRFFHPGGHASVTVRISGQRRVVALTVSPNAGSDPRAAAEWRSIAAALSRAAFADQPVDLWLQDPAGKRVATLPWEPGLQ